MIYNKDEALERTQKDYPHLFKKATITGLTHRERSNAKYMDKLNTMRDMRYKKFMTLQEIGDSLKPKITRQGVRHLLMAHFPLERLIDVQQCRAEKAKRLKIEKGDRVWFLMPHNGTIEKIYKDGSVDIKPDVIGDDVSIGRFDRHEIDKLTTP